MNVHYRSHFIIENIQCGHAFLRSKLLRYRHRFRLNIFFELWPADLWRIFSVDCLVRQLRSSSWALPMLHMRFTVTFWAIAPREPRSLYFQKYIFIFVIGKVIAPPICSPAADSDIRIRSLRFVCSDFWSLTSFLFFSNNALCDGLHNMIFLTNVNVVLVQIVTLFDQHTEAWRGGAANFGFPKFEIF